MWHYRIYLLLASKFKRIELPTKQFFNYFFPVENALGQLFEQKDDVEQNKNKKNE